MSALSRRQFITAQENSNSILRPPWAITENKFINQCSRCFKCAESCDLNLIIKGPDGYPRMYFKKDGCTYCSDCVSSCPDSALIKQTKAAWSQLAVINDQCLSKQGITCQSCGELCATQAIEFKPLPHNLVSLNVNPKNCNGCGECINICPVAAIKIEKQTHLKGASNNE